MDLVNAACRFVSQAVLPPLCIVCGDGGDGFVPGIDICGACVADLPLNGPACSLCAMPLPSTSLVSPICGQCLKKRPKYQASFCAYRYGYPIDHLLRAFKFHGRLAYGRVLGELLSIALSSARRETWPKILVPVPLADARFRDRGFNQAVELGRIVEARLGIPLRPDIAVRNRMTREQAGLDRKSRRKNVRGAFAIATKLPAKHIALLDDVVTTGSTVSELARVLRRAGADRIEVWAVARTAR